MPEPPAAQPSKKPPNWQTAPRIGADRRAAIAVEYALVGSLVVLVALAGLTLFGDSASGLWAWLSGELRPAMTP